MLKSISIVKQWLPRSRYPRGPKASFSGSDPLLVNDTLVDLKPTCIGIDPLPVNDTLRDLMPTFSGIDPLLANKSLNFVRPKCYSRVTFISKAQHQIIKIVRNFFSTKCLTTKIDRRYTEFWEKTSYISLINLCLIILKQIKYV